MPYLWLLKHWRWIAGALLLLAIAGMVVKYGHDQGKAGEARGRAEVQAVYDQFKADQATLASDQLKAQQALLLAREQQLKDAQDENAKNHATLASMRLKPVGGLQCTSTRSAGSDSVLTSPASSNGVAAGAGVVPQGSGEGTFDPVPAVIAMADRADDLVEACRTALAGWPK